MDNVDVNLIFRPYDQYTRLIMGAVETPGINLSVNYTAPLKFTFDEGVHGGEISFNRYVASYANGDAQLVGIPAFVVRGFRHRSYIVRQDSPLRDLASLRGKRIGTNSWGDSGTMWSRAALREAGVGVGDVQWVIGDLDESTKKKKSDVVDFEPPAGSEYLAEGRNLLAALRAGEIDAVTTAFMPQSVFERGGEFRRVVEDFRTAERACRERTGVFPASHIIAFDRDFAERHPAAVFAVYKGFQASWAAWWAMQRNFAQTSPWAMAEVETIIRDFPEDFPPFGTDRPAMQRMLAAICEEQEAQGLVAKAADPARLFADFDRLIATIG